MKIRAPLLALLALAFAPALHARATTPSSREALPRA
jgi:hypothetical protein